MGPSYSSRPKSVLITGCSAGGIGSALAFSFQRRGYYVLATARNVSKIDPALTSLPSVTTIKLDVTSDDSIAAAVVAAREALASEKHAGLGYLVNNSGVGTVMPWLDMEMNEARRLFETNFWGVLMVTKAFMPLLIEGQGTLVNIASVAAKAWNPYETIYNASKAAIQQWGDTLRLELEPLGVGVVSVMAGMIQSQWYSNSVPPLQLPEDSYYQPVLKNIQGSVTGVANKESGTPPDVFAETVVKQLVDGKTGKIWAGTLSTLIWTVGWLPDWVSDYILRDRSGLGGMKKLKNV
ncbi:NAD(P)-binding protein [Lophium mytilinum]|uniref:NAD(P)-binding protein n=1 Tax=Lophium mytilinum TaxID=390894 RepID=A0A6A6QJY3_9PEZI|nr:NAD(P)-binding protein [Lophium mytilinum]